MTFFPHAAFRTQPGPHDLTALDQIDAIGRRAGTIGQIARHLAVWSFLLAIAWLAHFSLSRNIGFYSDDQTFAVRQLAWTPADFSLWIRTKVMTYPEPQGRPLGFMLGILFAYWGDKLDGVDGMFVVGWLILSLNTILFYHLLGRCFTRPIPLLGAIGFLLFPADTTRPFLCHQHILQPSLTFMLIAAHLYLGGGVARQILAYIVATLCLITYESAMLPFIAIPLLEQSRGPQWRRRFARHIAVMLLIIAFIGLTRKLGHEYRTEEANGSKITVLVQIAAGSFIGPVTAILSFVYRGFTALGYLWKSPESVLAFAAAAGAFWLVLWGKENSYPAGRADEIRRAVQFGAVALGVSYLLSFTHFPPFYLEGQTTSVHLAAALGASTLFAAGTVALLRRPSGHLVAMTMIAIYLGLLMTSATAEQEGYVALWQERQNFWSRLVDLCPDLTDHTLVICDGQLPQPNRLMPANCWSDSMVLEQMFQFPDRFVQPPQVSCFPKGQYAGWLARQSSGEVVWIKSPYGRAVGDRLVEGNTILLHMDSTGALTRAAGTIDIGGKPFRLRDRTGRQAIAFLTLPFYDVLIRAAR